VDEAIVLADRILVMSHGVIAGEYRVASHPGHADLRATLLAALGVFAESEAN
jgi:ABC-type nitrate/sulfonate/bicarbonate transport system ATPase subunit